MLNIVVVACVMCVGSASSSSSYIKNFVDMYRTMAPLASLPPLTIKGLTDDEKQSLDRGLKFASGVTGLGTEILVSGSDNASDVAHHGLESALHFAARSVVEGTKLAAEGLDVLDEIEKKAPHYAGTIRNIVPLVGERAISDIRTDLATFHDNFIPFLNDVVDKSHVLVDKVNEFFQKIVYVVNDIVQIFISLAMMAITGDVGELEKYEKDLTLRTTGTTDPGLASSRLLEVLDPKTMGERMTTLATAFKTISSSAGTFKNVLSNYVTRASTSSPAAETPSLRGFLSSLVELPFKGIAALANVTSGLAAGVFASAKYVVTAPFGGIHIYKADTGTTHRNAGRSIATTFEDPSGSTVKGDKEKNSNETLDGAGIIGVGSTSTVQGSAANAVDDGKSGDRIVLEPPNVVIGETKVFGSTDSYNATSGESEGTDFNGELELPVHSRDPGNASNKNSREAGGSWSLFGSIVNAATHTAKSIKNAVIGESPTDEVKVEAKNDEGVSSDSDDLMSGVQGIDDTRSRGDEVSMETDVITGGRSLNPHASLALMPASVENIEDMKTLHLESSTENIADSLNQEWKAIEGSTVNRTGLKTPTVVEEQLARPEIVYQGTPSFQKQNSILSGARVLTETGSIDPLSSSGTDSSSTEDIPQLSDHVIDPLLLKLETSAEISAFKTISDDQAIPSEKSNEHRNIDILPSMQIVSFPTDSTQLNVNDVLPSNVIKVGITSENKHSNSSALDTNAKKGGNELVAPEDISGGKVVSGEPEIIFGATENTPGASVIFSGARDLEINVSDQSDSFINKPIVSPNAPVPTPDSDTGILTSIEPENRVSDVTEPITGLSSYDRSTSSEPSPQLLVQHEVAPDTINNVLSGDREVDVGVVSANRSKAKPTNTDGMTPPIPGSTAGIDFFGEMMNFVGEVANNAAKAAVAYTVRPESTKEVETLAYNENEVVDKTAPVEKLASNISEAVVSGISAGRVAPIATQADNSSSDPSGSGVEDVPGLTEPKASAANPYASMVDFDNQGALPSTISSSFQSGPAHSKGFGSDIKKPESSSLPTDGGWIFVNVLNPNPTGMYITPESRNNMARLGS